jgi:hypothetical protein
MRHLKISIRHGEQTIRMEYPASPQEAERRFAELIQERTDGPGAIILSNDNVVKRTYRTDRNWPNEQRLATNEPSYPARP